MLTASYIAPWLEDFEIDEGVATPNTEKQRGVFEGLQRAINDIIRVFGAEGSIRLHKLPVDGRIDENVFKSARDAINEANFQTTVAVGFVPAPTSVEDTAQRAAALATFLTMVAGTKPDFQPKDLPGLTPTTETEPTEPLRSRAPLIAAIIVGSLVTAGVGVYALQRRRRS